MKDKICPGHGTSASTTTTLIITITSILLSEKL